MDLSVIFCCWKCYSPKYVKENKSYTNYTMDVLHGSKFNLSICSEVKRSFKFFLLYFIFMATNKCYRKLKNDNIMANRFI